VTVTGEELHFEAVERQEPVETAKG